MIKKVTGKHTIGNLFPMTSFVFLRTDNKAI